MKTGLGVLGRPVGVGLHSGMGAVGCSLGTYSLASSVHDGLLLLHKWPRDRPIGSAILPVQPVCQ